MMVYSDTFLKCLNFVLRQEGGLSNHSDDKGGATNYGISTRFLNAHGINKKVTDLTVEDVRQIYYTYIWLPSQAEKFENLTVQLFLFDCAVNHGINASASLLQQVLNFLTPNVKSAELLNVDGIIGPKTLKAYNNVVASINESLLFETMKLVRGGYYLHIIERDPTQKVFLKGWLRRNMEVFSQIK